MHSLGSDGLLSQNNTDNEDTFLPSMVTGTLTPWRDLSLWPTFARLLQGLWAIMPIFKGNKTIQKCDESLVALVDRL